jgi:flagellar biosynthetic protein FliQ
MEYDWAMGLVNQLLWDSMMVAGPMLIATLVTGVLISILQVATQIQEMTLSYVPKLVVSAAILILLGGWMIHRVTLFALKMISLIPEMH